MSALDPDPAASVLTDRSAEAQLLLRAGRLLLEYNESSGEILRTVTATAAALTDEPCHVALSYRGVAVSLGGSAPALQTVHELRYNAAVQTRVHEILDGVRRGATDACDAVARLDRVEGETPRQPRWLVASLLGAGAASFAVLLGADTGAAAVAGVASALGLLVRQELGRRHFSLLTLPLAAAFLGALLGGLAIRRGWTHSPELVLVVPALMLVPGPHLLNGLLDLVDNQLPMSLSRLGLATGILLASGLGIVLGVELTLPDPSLSGQSAAAEHLNLITDMLLAGIATCGFALFYNTSWRQMGMVVAGGMAGHGLRFLAMKFGCRLEVATFLGGLTVGAVAAWMVRSSRAPIAVMAFAGAVTMIPGLSLYRALAGALQLAQGAQATDPQLASRTLTHALQGGLAVGGLALGLILGSRSVLALTRRTRVENPDGWLPLD